jgi:hypothetical protein
MNTQRGWGEAIIGSDARPVSRGGMVTLSRGELMDLTRNGKTRARRAFTYAAVIFGICGFGAGLAFGETITIGDNVYVKGGLMAGTTVSLAPSAAPGEMAVVTFENRHVNDGGDTGTYVLSMEGLIVEVDFTWDADPLLGSDRITVRPPDGVLCLPESCAVTVIEGFTGTVILYDWRGM